MRDDFFQALASPYRREIIRLLKWRTLSAGEIAGHFDIAQPSVSRHLEVLKDAGIITSRRQANQVIYSLNLSMVQEMIMEMSCKIENMMNMLYKLCWQADQGQDVRILAGMAKYYCSKATCEVVDDAIQVLAGIGVVGDHRVGRYYIDIRSARIAGGSDQVMVFNTAPQILKRYR